MGIGLLLLRVIWPFRNSQGTNSQTRLKHSAIKVNDRKLVRTRLARRKQNPSKPAPERRQVRYGLLHKPWICIVQCMPATPNRVMTAIKRRGTRASHLNLLQPLWSYLSDISTAMRCLYAARHFGGDMPLAHWWGSAPDERPSG